MANATKKPGTREKLLDVVEVLLTVKPDEHFDMRRWRDSCGTAGCVVHHYILARPNIGLKFEDHGKYMPLWSPVFEGRDGFDALALYFEIPVEDVEHIFDADCYDHDLVSPRDVIDRIRDFLSEPISDEERGEMMEGDRFDGLA